MHCDANTGNTHLRNNVVRRININNLLRKSLWENGRCVVALELGAIWMHTPALESANRTTGVIGCFVDAKVNCFGELFVDVDEIRLGEDEDLHGVPCFTNQNGFSYTLNRLHSALDFCLLQVFGGPCIGNDSLNHGPGQTRGSD